MNTKEYLLKLHLLFHVTNNQQAQDHINLNCDIARMIFENILNISYSLLLNIYNIFLDNISVPIYTDKI